MKTTLPGFSIKGNSLGLLFTAVLLIMALSSTFATDQKYSDSWGKQGLRLNRQGTDGLSLNFSVQHFGFSDIDINGERMTSIEFSESFLPNEEGAPDMPGFGRYIAIPNGATPVLEIVNMRTEHFSNMEMAPAPRIPLDTERGPLSYSKNPDIYSTNAFYPAQPAMLGKVGKMRGVDVCMLSIQPYSYNPVTKELIVYRDLELNIRFEGGNGTFGEDRYRNRFWDPILEDAIFNFGSLPKVDYDKRAENNNRSVGYDYLIIVPNDPIFSQWGDSIKKFRNEEGIYTGMIKLSDIGTNVTAAMLETYVNNAYSTWDIPPVAILLLGDFGQASANNNSITSPIWDSYCVSDNIYADTDNDDMPEIIFARITAQNAAQLESMIGRFLKYERHPPVNPGFYANPITALGWQTERWFQICSETVGGFWKNGLGKTPVRINEIYDGTPGSTWSTAQNTATVVGVFGPNGLGYIPATPGPMGGWSGGNSTMINNALNAGSFMLMHRDHGMETGWGEPSYTNSSINGLTNTDLSFILSINCLTGKYNYGSESFAEKFHRYTFNNQPAGALGLIAASETSYSFVNDVYVWGLIDNMWPAFMPQYGSTPVSRGVLPAFGNAAGKYFLQQSNWPYNTDNKEVTYNLFHHHGDAFLKVCTEVPMNIAATYNDFLYENETIFAINASPNSLVCLSSNGVILGTGVTGFETNIEITIPPMLAGTRIKVTITRPNCNRYEGWVNVIPLVTAAIAGEDALICGGTGYQLAGQAVNYSSILWTTSGTGSFNNATILDPVYTPSVEDVVQGSVNLSLTASNPSANDSTDYMTLSLRAAPEVFAGIASEICAGESYTFSDATAANYTTIEWISSGTGTFDDPTAITPLYTPSAEDLSTGNLSFTMRAWNDICAPVESLTELTIRPLPEPAVSGPESICINQSGILYSAATSENTYQWDITGGIITEGHQTPAVTVTWDVAGQGNLTLSETTEFGCSASTEFPVMVNPLPAPAIDGDVMVCANSPQVVYSTSPVEGNSYEWNVTGGELVAGAGTNAVTVNWGGNGMGLLSLVQTNTATTCSAGAEYNVTINSPVISLGSDTTICLTHILSITVDGTFSSYNWSDGSTMQTTIVNGATQGINSSEYSVTVTDENGCEGNSSIMVTVEACAGLNEHSARTGINIFPNPNSGDFTLEISNAVSGNAIFSIANTTGGIIYSDNIMLSSALFSKVINLNLESGIYFLKVETQNGTAIQKLVIR